MVFEEGPERAQTMAIKIMTKPMNIVKGSGMSVIPILLQGNAFIK